MSSSGCRTSVLCCVRSLSILIFLIPATELQATDWPMWRHDASRSAATDEPLPEQLHLRWTRQAPKLQPAWEQDPRLHYDAVYEPIVAGGLMYVASSHNDSVIALDPKNGSEVWRFLAGGPIRFAPIAHQGLLYFGADDGCFYCLRQATGEVNWKFQVAPNERRVLGNGRLSSVWPVRGGAVLHEGRIWFTAGVWPFEGTFLYSFDVAGSEDVRSVSGDGARAVLIRDSGLKNLKIETLDRLTPQGYLVASGDRLIIPCGRSNTAIRNQLAGDIALTKYSTHGTTNYHVSGNGRFLFHGSLSFDLETSKTLSFAATTPAFTLETAYFGKGDSLFAQGLINPREVVTKDRRGNDVTSLEFPVLWSIPGQAVCDLPAEATDEKWLAANPLRIDLKAGSRLYGHLGDQIFAVETDTDGGSPTPVWKTRVSGVPRSMLAADGQLFAVTEEGMILCFGASVEDVKHHQQLSDPLAADSAWSDRVAKILAESKTQTGYCLVLGAGSGGLVKELVRQSELQLIVLERDSAACDSLRVDLDRHGLYGTRVTVVEGDLSTISLPPYFASLTVSESTTLSNVGFSDQTLQTLYRNTRPYGGSWMLPLDNTSHGEFSEIVNVAKPARAELRRAGEFSILTRVGSLPGAADWTHEYGDPSNTLMSRDELVKAPLGVLWFGGPSSSSDLYYNRHFWGPGMAVVGGRMLIQGPGKLTAVDVYTGRILWKHPLEDIGGYRPGRRGNDFEDQLSGFHFLAVEDGIYLVLVDRCLRIDPDTGNTLAEFRFEDPADKWGSVRVEGDLLVAELFRETEKSGLMPLELVVLNRYTGEKKWSRKADLSFPLHAVSADKVFCFDGALEDFYRDWKRKGLIPKAAEKKSLVAYDLQTGDELWRVPSDTVVTWLSFSSAHNILMAANRDGMSAFHGGDGYQLWKKEAQAEGFKGHPENLWDKIILWNDQILDQRGPGRAYSIQTGVEIQRKHPITNQDISWEFTKSGHHCNYAVANPHLMTFRADTAGFCDIENATTARLDGYRPGCRNSLIPANGVLNSPNFAEGCICGYPLFTSLSLVHLPEAETWSYSALKVDPKTDSIERLGVNLGAPGDHVADDKTYWIGYPNKTGASPSVGLAVEGTVEYFRQHTSLSAVRDMDWIVTSGVMGATRISIQLGGKSASESIVKKPGKYTVRLFFAEPVESIRVGDRVFDVAIQGTPVLQDLDVVDAARGVHQPLVRMFTGIEASDAIDITLTAKKGQTVLSGVELVLESDSAGNPKKP